MKNLRKFELEAKVKKLERSESALHIALHSVLNDTPEAQEQFNSDGWAYAYRLYKSAHPAGGVVLIIMRPPGGARSVSADFLDDLLERADRGSYDSETGKGLTALRNLSAAREALLAQKSEAA